jgi:serine protease Do
MWNNIFVVYGELAMSIKPFYVGTCENKAHSESRIVLKPFLIEDPLGLRKAIVPVLKCYINGEVERSGTAFHIDGWGTFLTADHVIDFSRSDPSSASTWTEISQNPNGDHIILLLGTGLNLGTPTIPKEAFAFVKYVGLPIRAKDNPWTNREEPERAVDIAVMMAEIQPETSTVPRPHVVSVRSSNSCPLVGETVLAVGFPKLNDQYLDEDSQVFLLTDGMYGAYGIVTAIHPHGRSKSTPTPVFEVECNWPSGMSGGPVFNSLGEVVGLVSRGMDFLSGNGDGVATCFGLIPYFSEIVPMLDVSNPAGRRGWAVWRRNPWHLAGFFKTKPEAEKLANSMSTDYQVEYGLNNLETGDFGSLPTDDMFQDDC